MSRHRHFGRNRQYSYDYDDDYYDDYDDYDDEEEARQLEEYNREQREARAAREREVEEEARRASTAAISATSASEPGPYGDSDAVIAGVMSSGFSHKVASSAYHELNPTSQLPYDAQVEAVVDFILNKPINPPPSSSSMKVDIPAPLKPPSPVVIEAPPMSPPRFYKEGTAMSPPSAGLKSLWSQVEQDKATSAVKRQLNESLRNASYKVANPSFMPMYADNIKETTLPPGPPVSTNPITICVSGHIDHGKTTLVVKMIQMLDGRKVVLDTGLAEKSRSCTTDVSAVSCTTPAPSKRTLTILDTPGHEGYSLQLIPALFECDVGVFVVSCKRGEFEDCWGGAGKIHLQSMVMAGVGKIVVAVNKCDVGDWEPVGKRVVEFLQKEGGGVQATACGVSGLTGENIPGLVSSIEAASGLRKGKGAKTFRATISSVAASGRRVNMQVKVVRGNLTVGETVSVAPSGVCGLVKEVTLGDKMVSSGTLNPGDNATISVTNMDGERVFAGDVLVRSGDLRRTVNTRRRLIAKIEVGEKCIIKGTELTFTMNATSVACVVAHVLDGDERMVRGSSRGRVTLVLKRPICIETYEECKKLGRMLLLDGARIAAVGMIEELR